MSHNALINGSSHSISSGKSLINGTGYKVSAGKTLINGTGKNIGFVPKKWHWIYIPSVENTTEYNFSFSVPGENSYSGILLKPNSNSSANMYYYGPGYQVTAYRSGYGWTDVIFSTIVCTESPSGEILNILQANATPIYD